MSPTVGFTMATDPTWIFGSTAQAYTFIGWGLYSTMVHLDVHEWVAILVMIVLEAGWQIGQAYIEYDATPDWTLGYILGGAGFNYVNMIWATSGIILGFLIDLMHKPSVRPLSGYRPTLACDYIKKSLSEEQYEDCMTFMEDIEAENEAELEDGDEF